MEHLLEKKLYKRNIATGKFNQNYITQLVKNYRCHSTILRKPSELFYGGVLEAAAPESMFLELFEFIFIWIYCYSLKMIKIVLQIVQIGSLVQI